MEPSILTTLAHTPHRPFRPPFGQLNSKPEWDARRSGEQLYAAYRRSGLTLEEFEGPSYQHIGHIQKLIADGVLAADPQAPPRCSRITSPNGRRPT